MKKNFSNKIPKDIKEYQKLANDTSGYKQRLIAVKKLSKYNCNESKKILYNLMRNDKIFIVREESFRALQNFGENVKLKKKKKGKPIKSINKKLLTIHNSFNGDIYSLIDFKIKFKNLYPSIYDLYQYEKKGKFDNFIENSIKTFPKSKTSHEYTVIIDFEQTDFTIDKKISLEQPISESNNAKDSLEIKKEKIKITCLRNSKIELSNIVFFEDNSIHTQIIKSLIYFYISANRFIRMDGIQVIRRNSSTDEIDLKLPSKNIELLQILNSKFVGFDISSDLIEDIFKNDEKSVTLKDALTYLLKSTLITDSSEKFEKLWKSFNSIYRYLGNGLNENECQRNLRQHILDNSNEFKKTTELVKNMTVEEVRDKIRVDELIQNDYDNENKVVSFMAFVYRYSDNIISQLLLENLGYQRMYLESINEMNNIEKKFNKFNSIKPIYQMNKESDDINVYYNTVEKYLKENTKLSDENTKIEIVVFICIKYSYFLRNKLFHAEKQDLTFRFARNNIIDELDWINQLLESLIIELIIENNNW